LELIAMIRIAFAALLLSTTIANAEQAVDIPSRPGQAVRALIETPANATGSVILLSGGHGNLSLGANGSIGWGKGNQLVRTRAAYAKAGFAVAVPDFAPDLKRGDAVRDTARWSEEHARDLGAVVAHMRKIAPPVHLIGTSRAALSVTNAAVRLNGPQAPDTVTITAGMLVHFTDKQPSAERSVGNLGRIKQPVLIVYHRDDGCSYTPASSAERAKGLLTGAKRVDIKIMSGGPAGTGDPCQAQSPHGFIGLDAEVVALVTAWLKEQK
jgi:pimeloyl-ACP methyl ester carboxylesterase